MTRSEIAKASAEAVAILTARALEAERALTVATKALTDVARVLVNDKPLPSCFVLDHDAIVWQVRELKRQLAEAREPRAGSTGGLKVRATAMISPGGTD